MSPPKGYIKKKSKTIPFGYRLSEIKGYLAPIPEQQEILEKYLKCVIQEQASLREAAQAISTESGRKISHTSLAKMLKKDLWEILPNEYVKDDDGNFVLNSKGEPQRKSGRPKGATSSYNFSKAQKRKQKLNQEKKALEKLQQKVYAKKAKIQKEDEILDKVQGKSNNNIISESTEDLAQSTQNALQDAKVLFHPNEGPQTDFLAAGEKDVLYGGAAGGGKSYAMLIDPLRYCHKKAHRALILRRSMPELRELIDKSRELYPQAFPGAKFREVEKVWTFPSGAKVEFGFLEKDADVYRYQGQAYSWIGFDEITHLPTDFGWNYLASRLRTTDTSIETYLRCTANPGGVGAHWVKKRYIEPSTANTSFKGTDGLTRKFIPAKLKDNPYLAKDGVYETMLKSLPPTQRKQLLEGNWDIAEGAAFAEFDPSVHVIEPFQFPFHWERLKGIDYGYASESCCLWGTVDQDDGTLIIYRELYQKGLTGEELGSIIANMEEEDPFSVPGVLDTAAWAKTGYAGPTVGEALQKMGHKLRRADKNRVQGKIQIHEYLKVQDTGRPKLQIFSTCKNLIRELQSIPLAKNNSEDVDTHASDHAYDALRYMIMSRPSIYGTLQRLRDVKRYVPSDSTFGY
jgi:hypothetical protein|tara:strand:- start:1235 stop:3118 length:1884 start_codon:yes stop_codon:yes gene_type:complete